MFLTRRNLLRRWHLLAARLADPRPLPVDDAVEPGCLPPARVDCEAQDQLAHLGDGQVPAVQRGVHVVDDRTGHPHISR